MAGTDEANERRIASDEPRDRERTMQSRTVDATQPSAPEHTTEVEGSRANREWMVVEEQEEMVEHEHESEISMVEEWDDQT